jgi:hypothetical protein
MNPVVRRIGPLEIRIYRGIPLPDTRNDVLAIHVDAGVDVDDDQVVGDVIRQRLEGRSSFGRRSYSLSNRRRGVRSAAASSSLGNRMATTMPTAASC